MIKIANSTKKTYETSYILIIKQNKNVQRKIFEHSDFDKCGPINDLTPKFVVSMKSLLQLFFSNRVFIKILEIC